MQNTIGDWRLAISKWQLAKANGNSRKRLRLNRIEQAVTFFEVGGMVLKPKDPP
jgi:hypothetical protein